MKRIPLTQGKSALVDDEDFEWLSQWKWYYAPVGYATRNKKTGRKRRAAYMHSEVNKTPKGMVTDHINRDKLDNRRSNLRSITRGKNQWNRVVPKNNTSGVLGVGWYKALNLWEPRIKVNRRNVYLGRFKKKSDAIKVREAAVLKYFSL